MSRPYLLLDIDGTLNPDLRASWDSPDGPTRARVRAAGWHIHNQLFNGRPIWYNPWTGEMLRNIAARTGAELAWATRWGPLANQWFSPAIGLPFDLALAPTHPALAKGDTVLPWTQGRPFVWLDDEQAVADACTGPGQHCVMVDPFAGVTHWTLAETERLLEAMSRV